MNLLQRLFSRKEEPITNYNQFWNWFHRQERHFHNVVKKGERIEEDFFDVVSPRLATLKEGFFLVSGMYDDHTAELVITADGSPKNIVFVEELVAAAPQLPGWKFTALKPAMDIDNVCIQMDGYVFDSESLSFYANNTDGFPDEIDITMIHRDYKEADRDILDRGTYIFLDHFLGELTFTTVIDYIIVKGPESAEEELIPITKLKEYLLWRQKEFIERTELLHYDSSNDSYAAMEAQLENGKPVVAVINTALLDWDYKAAYPWMLKISITYEGNVDNGMPDKITYQQMDELEDQVVARLPAAAGYLNLGRQTGDNNREAYFACRDFRQPAKVLQVLVDSYSGRLNISFDIYKDKYWQTMNRFRAQD